MNKMKETLMMTVAALAFLTLTGLAKADENTNTVTTYLKKEWEETVSFQKKNWADGKSQWSRNKDQIKSLWIRISGTEKNND